MGAPATGSKTSDQTGPGRASLLVRLFTPEKSLAGKVAKGSEAGKVVDQQFMWLGTQLAIHLYILFKTLRIHDRTNTVVHQLVDIVLTLISTLAQDDVVVLRLQDDFLFLGDIYLKVSPQQFPIVTEFIDSLNARGIGAISFTPAVRAADVREFASLFVGSGATTVTVADLKRQLKDRGVQGIDVEAVTSRAIRIGGRNKQAKLLARHCYVKAVEAVGETVESVREGRVPYFKRVKRVIQNLVDLIMEEESVVLGLTTLRCHDQYTLNHSVNVALLSIALANRVGFSKAALVDVGLAGAFHDIGKVGIPLATLNKPAEFTEEEWEIIRTHPTVGVMVLARLRGATALSGRIAAAAFEHHMQYDLAGYPALAVPWKQSLTSRLVTVADAYDALTSSRVYRREPMAPANALKLMFAHSGRLFDPILLKLLVNCVGVLPIGSLVLLDSNELAVVTRCPQKHHDPERPWVKVITDVEGNPTEGPEVDLTEMGPDGQYQRSVAGLVDNTKYRFDTGRYFV